MTTEISRILSAKNPFAKLGLLVQETEPSAVRIKYKALALLIHPDKCKEPNATQAFAALSDAFEQLYDESSQQKCLRDLLKRPGAHTDANRKRTWKESSAKKDARQAKWSWQQKPWAEVEKELKRREAEEARQRQAFIRFKSEHFSRVHSERRVRAAQKLAMELDSRVGKSENRLWKSLVHPPSSQDMKCRDREELTRHDHGCSATCSSSSRFESTSSDSDADEDLVLPTLEEVASYLRGTHYYCFFCGTQYENASDLASSCPGTTEEDHQSQCNPQEPLSDDDFNDEL